MKVCHFVASTGLGRGEIYIDLANEMCHSIEVSLVIPAGAKYLERIDPRIHVFEYKARDNRRNPFLLAEVYRLIKHADPDIVHTHFAKATQIFVLLNTLLKLPHIATKHNPRKAKIFRRVPHVVAVSEEVKRTINENAVVIYNGIRPVSVGRKIDRNGCLRLLAVGRLDTIKGFDDLIRAVSGLNFPFRLTIIGEGEERPSLEKLIHELGLEKQVSLPGYRTDIPENMTNTDISSHSEGCSVAVIEALFYAPLILSTRVGIAPEIFPDALLIENRDIAMKLKFAHDHYEQLCAEFRAFRAQHADRFVLSATVSRHIEVYERILRSRPRKQAS